MHIKRIQVLISRNSDDNWVSHESTVMGHLRGVCSVSNANHFRTVELSNLVRIQSYMGRSLLRDFLDRCRRIFCEHAIDAANFCLAQAEVGWHTERPDIE